MSPYTHHKTLGCYSSPSDSNDHKQLKEKSDAHGNCLYASDCNTRESQLFYFNIYLPSVTYPLAVLSMTRVQLQEVQKRATHLMLQKYCYNPNTRGALVYCLNACGGYGFLCLYAEQGLLSTQMFIKFWRFNSHISLVLKPTYHWAQYQTGTSSSFLFDVDNKLPHLESKWLGQLRTFLVLIGGKLVLDNPNMIKLQSHRDNFIMDQVLALKHFSTGEIKKINYCRLYLNVTLVSNVAMSCGKRINSEALTGDRKSFRSCLQYLFCKQQKPGPAA